MAIIIALLGWSIKRNALLLMVIFTALSRAFEQKNDVTASLSFYLLWMRFFMATMAFWASSSMIFSILEKSLESKDFSWAV